MALGRRKPYDRTRILAEAAKARKKGRHRKALALYRQVLAVEPANPNLHRKVAPLLAREREPEQAWQSYRQAAQGLLLQGFSEHAIGLYREASRTLPTRVEVWQALAELELERGRAADAIGTLLEGRRHFRARRSREQAVQLLLQARRIDPCHFEASFDLACLLARSGASQRARRLLEELDVPRPARERRRVRGRLFRMSPTPRAAWRWLAAALCRARGPVAPGRALRPRSSASC